MKYKIYIIIRAIAIFLGFSDIVGFIWYMDYFVSEPLFIILFSLTPGIALLTLPFIPESFLRLLIVRILSILIGVFAIAREIYKIKSDLNLPNYPDVGAIMIRTFTVIVLVMLILRIAMSKKLKNIVSAE